MRDFLLPLHPLVIIMPRRPKKKAKVAAAPTAPLEAVAAQRLAAWRAAAPTMMVAFREKLGELRPVDEEAVELLGRLESQRERYLVQLGLRWARQEAGEELGLEEKVRAQIALEKVRADNEELLECAREKIELATEAYDIVDAKIKRLDQVLSALDARYPTETGVLREIHEQSVYAAKLKQRNDDSFKGGAVGGASPGRGADKGEPKYCLCRSDAHGTMVGCDHEECEKEWFHLHCVGLDKMPEEGVKWYCPECFEMYGDPNKPRRGRKKRKKS